ncbi:MAG: hypothetical protein ACKVOK_00535, partial [Flavobacteriales bacterium]
MKSNWARIIFIIAIGIATGIFFAFRSPATIDAVAYTVDPSKQELAFYWRDDSLKNLGNFVELKEFLSTKKKSLVFATNGGMYDLKRSP